jgi:meso-butanediol dehydrogenase / (S,S)-butanediol dehydrogenase / diacetyl reductase
MSAEVALVTGAASGIGAAVARRLAARGARVALVDRNEEGLKDTASSIAEAGGQSLSLVADISSDDGVRHAVHHAAKQLGPLTTVVACAGIALLGDVTTVEPEAWNQTLAFNVTGVYLTARHTIPQLIDAGGGTFTAIASDAGVWGAQGYAAYCASKHAVVGLIKCMALDHGPRGVRCNAVCPGFVETPMAQRIFADTTPAERDFFMSSVPLGRFAQPEEVAAAVAHLSCAEASYTNGALYRLDGGSTAGYYVNQ